jgi:hypothetical protein
LDVLNGDLHPTVGTIPSSLDALLGNDPEPTPSEDLGPDSLD